MFQLEPTPFSLNKIVSGLMTLLRIRDLNRAILECREIILYLTLPEKMVDYQN